MLLTLHHFSDMLVSHSRRLGLLLKKKGKFMVVCLPWLDMAQGCLMHWVPLWKRNSFPTKPVFLKQEEKIKIKDYSSWLSGLFFVGRMLKIKQKNLKTCKYEDFIQERASMYFFFCRPHFHGPCTSGLQSSWEESQVLSCSLIHICQGLGLTDEECPQASSPLGMGWAF